MRTFSWCTAAFAWDTPRGIIALSFPRRSREWSLFLTFFDLQSDYTDLPRFCQRFHAEIFHAAQFTCAASRFIAYNTICNRVANRASELIEFAKSVDIIIFVSGTNSSNGKYLYECCKKVKNNTLFISDEKELKVEMFENINKIGITGATSTPMWLMEKIEEWLHQNV